MKTLNVFKGSILLLVIFFITCEKENSPSTREAKTVLLIMETIGISGGVIETDGISIEIPSGAFSADQEISVYSKEMLNNHPFKTDAVSGLFELEGFPSDFTKSITFKFESIAEDEECYLAVGESYPFLGGDTSIMTFRFIETEIDNGYISAIIDPDDEAKTSLKSMSNSSNPLIGLEQLICLQNHDKVKATYAEIDYPKHIAEEDIIRLGTFIDEAIEKIKTFDLAIEKKILSKIYVSDLNSFKTLQKKEFIDSKSYYKPIIPLVDYNEVDFLRNYKAICLSDNFSDQTEVEMAAYRYLFVNACPANQLKSIRERNLCVGAFNGWAQSKIAINNFMAPIGFDKVIHYPFYGFFSSDLDHEYILPGFAPYLIYLDNNYESDDGNLIIDIYKDLDPKTSDLLKENMTLFNAINYNMNMDACEWYPDFVKQYITNQVIDFGSYIPILAATENIKMEESYDMKYNERRSFYAYETKMYSLDPSKMNVNEDYYLMADAINFTTPDNGSKDDLFFHVFKNNGGGDIEFIKSSQGGVTITDLKEFTNSKILITATYCPKNEKTNSIEIQFKFDQKAPYQRGVISIFVEYTCIYVGEGNYIATCADKEEETKQGCISCYLENINIEGNKLTAQWDRINENYQRPDFGDIEILFTDENLKTVTEFTVKKYSSERPDCHGEHRAYSTLEMSCSGLTLENSSVVYGQAEFISITNPGNNLEIKDCKNYYPGRIMCLTDIILPDSWVWVEDSELIIKLWD